MSLRWRADDGPLIVVFGSFLPHQTKKKCWTPSDKTFWILACIKCVKTVCVLCLFYIVPWAGCSFYSRYHEFCCSLWLWYFLIILTHYFCGLCFWHFLVIEIRKQNGHSGPELLTCTMCTSHINLCDPWEGQLWPHGHYLNNLVVVH